MKHVPLEICDLPLVLRVEEAAQVLTIGRNACYEAIKRGEIRARKIGRRLLVPRAEIERLLRGAPGAE
jgi:excisionase family DNA binding protein